MTPNPITVRQDEPLSNAIAILRDNRFRSVPVVDENGKMLGQFGIHALLRLLVPKIATMRGGLTEMSFVNDDFEDLKRRLSDEYEHPVANYIENDFNVIHPDTALTHVALSLYNCHDNLPVVDSESDTLVGIVSYWDIVGRLLEEQA